MNCLDCNEPILETSYRRLDQCRQCEIDETAEWLDGPGFMEWLTGCFPESVAVRNADSNCKWSRRFYAWRHGDHASVEAVDRLLIEMGLHIALIPSSLFIAEDPRQSKSVRRFRPEEKDKALRIYMETQSPTEAAGAIGCVPRTVTEWAKELQPA